MIRFSLQGICQPMLVAMLCVATAALAMPRCAADDTVSDKNLTDENVSEDHVSRTLDQLIAAGQLAKAVSTGRRLIADGPNENLTLPLARLARTLQQNEKLTEAAEFYQHAVAASSQPNSADIAAEKVILIRLAAAAVATQVKRYDAAIKTLRPLFEKSAATSASQQQIAVSILLRGGADALSTGNAAVAAEAYKIAMAYGDEQQHPTAMLGEAWATAIQQSQPQQAADKLAAFLRQYPQHEDAANAARARGQCLTQAGQPEQAEQQLEDVLRRWPESDSAWQVAKSFQLLAPDLVPPAAVDWLIERGEANRLDRFDAMLTRFALTIAIIENNEPAWENLSRHLAAIDQNGQATSDLLSFLSNSEHQPAAERLAMRLIARQDDLVVTPQAREAACRWSGRQLRWSMLALASEDEDLDEPNPSRTLAIERLMAEALVQTGKPAAARRWWNHLVDRRHADDFATLLRCAEMETSTGNEPKTAKQRIETARQAAGEDPFRLTLVNLLAAELAIRQSEFDQARALLESVVRESDTSGNLRGRAQWLIGETFYLQQQFSKSIEAYRLVEGIDPGGDWVAASLLQAGKAFEQLSRPHEASICYGHLLRRFAGSPYAGTARKRMAALTSDSSTLNR